MAGLLPYISIAAACVLSLVVLIGRHPVTSIAALVIGAFCNYPVFVFAQGYNSALFVTDIVLGFVFLRYVSGWKKGPNAQSPPWLGLAIGIVVIVVISRLIVLARVPDVKSLQQLLFYTFRIVTFVSLFVLPSSVIYTRRNMTALLGTFSICTGIVGFLGILQYAGLVDLSFSSAWLVVGREWNEQASDLHVFLLGYNRSTLGLLMAVSALVSIGHLSVTQSRLMQVVCLASASVCLITLLGSHSRSGLIGLLAGITMMLVYLRAGQAVVLATVLGMALVAALMLFGEQFELTERYRAMFSRQDLMATTSSRVRLDEWAKVAAYLMTHPIDLLIGCGYLDFSPYYNGYLQITTLSHGHNLVVHTVGELGLIGAAVLFGWYARSAALLLKLRSNLAPREGQRLFFACIFGALAAGVGAGVGDDTLYPTPGAWPFLEAFLPILGATMAYANQTLQEDAFGHAALTRQIPPRGAVNPGAYRGPAVPR